MRKFISILLIISLIGSATGFDELIKFPFLIQHYAEHKQIHPADSFFQYLHKHYIKHQKADSEQDRKSDTRLPFKSIQHAPASFAFVLPANQPIVIIIEQGIVLFKPFRSNNPIPVYVNIWQPPKLG